MKKTDKELDESFDKLFEVINSNAKRTITLITEDCLSEAQIRAPIKTGNLRGSGRAEVFISESPTRIRGIVSFNTSYALRVHESQFRLGARSAQAGPLVGNKYLTRALNDNLEKYYLFFSREMNKAILKSFKS